MNNLKIGDVVKFDETYKEVFIEETTGIDDATTKYQQLVLNGIKEVGMVDELLGNLCNVKFSDGWKLPIPAKYLILISNSN
jgi:hypothetical protein